MVKRRSIKIEKNAGFTFIELLVVIAMIGVLAGVMMRVINQEKQQETAEDAVKRSDLKSLVDGFETFYAAERHYPEMDVTNDNNNPCDWGAPDWRTLYNYINCYDWEDKVGLDYYYMSQGVPAIDFCVYVQKSTDTNYYKYCSSWTGNDKRIRECSPTDIGNMGTCN